MLLCIPPEFPVWFILQKTERQSYCTHPKVLQSILWCCRLVTLDIYNKAQLIYLPMELVVMTCLRIPHNNP